MPPKASKGTRRARKLKSRQKSTQRNATPAQSIASSTPATHLPDEVWLEIFHYLDAKEKLAIKRVCKQFEQVLESATLWQDYRFETDWGSGPKVNTREQQRDLVKRQIDIVQQADGNVKQVCIKIAQPTIQVVFEAVLDHIILNCPAITQLHVESSFGGMIRRGIRRLERLEQLILVEDYENFFLHDRGGPPRVLPQSLRRLSVEDKCRYGDSRGWAISGMLEQLVLRGCSDLSMRNVLAFSKTLTCLDLTGYTLIDPTQSNSKTLAFRLDQLALLRQLKLSACIIEVQGPLPKSLVDLQVHDCYHDGASPATWEHSNLPQLKELSLRYFNSKYPTHLPIGLELLLKPLAYQTLATQSNELARDSGSAHQPRQSIQLETLILEDCSNQVDIRPRPIDVDYYLHPTLQSACVNLTVLSLIFPQLTSSILDDVAGHCPLLKDLTIGKANEIINIEVEHLIRRMSDRLQKFRAHRMPCYQSNTCFASAKDACCSLTELCRRLGIQVEISNTEGYETSYWVPFAYTSGPRSLDPEAQQPTYRGM